MGNMSNRLAGWMIWIVIDESDPNPHALLASAVWRIREAGAERRASAVSEKQRQRNAEGVEKDIRNGSFSVGHATLIPFIQDGDPDGQESRYGVEESVVWFSIPAESPKEQKR